MKTSLLVFLVGWCGGSGDDLLHWVVGVWSSVTDECGLPQQVMGFALVLVVQFLLVCGGSGGIPLHLWRRGNSGGPSYWLPWNCMFATDSTWFYNFWLPVYHTGWKPVCWFSWLGDVGVVGMICFIGLLVFGLQWLMIVVCLSRWWVLCRFSSCDFFWFAVAQGVSLSIYYGEVFLVGLLILLRSNIPVRARSNQ